VGKFGLPVNRPQSPEAGKKPFVRVGHYSPGDEIGYS
jgi:hypothetical protein